MTSREFRREVFGIQLYSLTRVKVQTLLNFLNCVFHLYQLVQSLGMVLAGSSPRACTVENTLLSFSPESIKENILGKVRGIAFRNWIIINTHVKVNVSFSNMCKFSQQSTDQQIVSCSFCQNDGFIQIEGRENSDRGPFLYFYIGSILIFFGMLALLDSVKQYPITAFIVFLAQILADFRIQFLCSNFGQKLFLQTLCGLYSIYLSFKHPVHTLCALRAHRQPRSNQKITVFYV